MHSPESRDFFNDSRFVRIEEPSLVVLDHVCPPRFQAHLRFEEAEEGCRIRWCRIFEDAKTCANVARYASDGNEQNLDRLVAVLSESGTG
jgi:hypothetical protein